MPEPFEKTEGSPYEKILGFWDQKSDENSWYPRNAYFSMVEIFQKRAKCPLTKFFLGQKTKSFRPIFLIARICITFPNYLYLMNV